MANRILKGAVLAGLVWASAGNAENCKEAVLYDGSNNNGQMENTGRTFPEAPEWRANWGDFENMKSPYIRLSGIKNGKADWTGTLALGDLPATTAGGTFSITVRSTQAGKFGVWLQGASGTGNVSFHTLKANSTKVITLPVRDMLGNANAIVNKVGIGLFGVPAYQYTTLFVDNIKLSCTGETGNVSSAGSEVATSSVTNAGNEGAGYFFRDVNPASSTRTFYTEPVPDAKKALGEESRSELSRRTSRQFVLTEQEHRQVVKFQTATSLTPQESRDGWYKSMFTVDRNRLKDSVIASPKNLFLEAGDIAASTGKRTVPVLVTDVDYAIKHYTDTTFTKTELEDFHLLLAGFPISAVYGSRVTFVYDPYFVATTRSNLPDMEICVKGKCTAVAPRSFTEIEFDSAGEQTVTVKLSSDGVTVKQNLKLEVK